MEQHGRQEPGERAALTGNGLTNCRVRWPSRRPNRRLPAQPRAQPPQPPVQPPQAPNRRLLDPWCHSRRSNRSNSRHCPCRSSCPCRSPCGCDPAEEDVLFIKKLCCNIDTTNLPTLPCPGVPCCHPLAILLPMLLFPRVTA